MRDCIDLRAFHRAHAAEPLVLCTLIRKQHFGYRAVGAKKLITAAGQSCGLLSGGCLEAEIVRTALDDMQGSPLIRDFSTTDEADRLFGYQTGCPGVITILFETVPPYADIDLYVPFGSTAPADGVLATLNDATGTLRRFASSADAAPDLFFDRWVRPITLTIVGCGPDAAVFAELARPMGWSLRFVDYRVNATLPADCPYEPEIFPLDDLAGRLPADPLGAVVLMTHNYEADMTILKDLIGRNFGYVGCLGPRRRYEQMKDDLARLHGVMIPTDWEQIVQAPAGLFTSGRSPEEIALSVIAQIQATLRSPEQV